jgi:hypothetical protein
VPQGHPFSGLCFAVGAHKSIIRLDEILREEELALAEQRRHITTEVRTKGAVSAFFDDITFGGEAPVLCKVGERAGPVLAAIGLELVPHKCALIGPTADIIQEPPSGFELRRDGAKNLGCPVGTQDYRYQKFDELINNQKPNPRALKLLDQRLAFRLLYYAHNTRLVYVSRICEFGSTILHPALKEHDDAIDECLAALTGIDDGAAPERIHILRQQPQSQGGLGMNAYYGAFTERNKILSRYRTRAFAEAHLPQLLPVFDNDNIWCKITIGEHCGMSDVATAAEAAYKPTGDEADDYKKYADATKAGLLAVYKEEHTRFHQTLIRSGELDNAAYLLSGSEKGSGRWLLCLFALGTAYFTGLEFSKSLSQRLLVPIWKNGMKGPPQCKCGGPRGFAHVNLVLHPHHEQSCHDCNSLRTRRHHTVKEYLAKLIRDTLDVDAKTEVRHRKNEQTGFFYEEMTSEKRPPRDSHQDEKDPSLIIADIAFSTDTTNSTLIDVGIVDPAAARHIQKSGSSRIAGAAAVAEENRKTTKYRTAFPLLNKAGGPKFYPFIIEAGGRLGPSARLFLDSLIPVTDEGKKLAQSPEHILVNKFLADLSMELARSGAWLIKAVNQGLAL